MRTRLLSPLGAAPRLAILRSTLHPPQKRKLLFAEFRRSELWVLKGVAAVRIGQPGGCLWGVDEDVHRREGRGGVARDVHRRDGGGRAVIRERAAGLSIRPYYLVRSQNLQISAESEFLGCGRNSKSS